MSLTITSTAFTPDGAIPSLYTCEGKDISPPLGWSGAPAGTKSFALNVDDPDAPDPAAPKMTWVHWVLYDIPAATNGLPEAVASSVPPTGRNFPPEVASRPSPDGGRTPWDGPEALREGVNGWGRTGY